MPPRRKEATEIEQYRALGMTDAEIKTVLLAKANRVVEITAAQPAPAAVQPAPANRSLAGPDPAVVARHQTATANLPPQPEPTKITVSLEDRWFKVLLVYRDILRGQRNEPDLTAEQAAAQLVRWAYGAHPDIKLVTSQGKSAFVHPNQRAG